MNIEALLSPQEFPTAFAPHGPVGAVAIDVLRATTVMTTALSCGVKAILPVCSALEGRTKLLQHPDFLLTGEERGLPPEGFHLGNSPLEFSQKADMLTGKTMIMSTTNGTRLLRKLETFLRNTDDLICAGAPSNLGALCRHLAQSNLDTILLCCAGNQERFSLEDAACAGYMIQLLLAMTPDRPPRLGDGAQAALSLSYRFPNPMDAFRASQHGQYLISLGLEDDLAFCAETDRYSVVPVFRQGRVVAANTPEALAPLGVSIKSGQRT